MLSDNGSSKNVQAFIKDLIVEYKTT